MYERDHCNYPYRRVEPTKDALEFLDVKGITFVSVIGRGRQGGKIQTPDPEGNLRRDVGVYMMQHGV